MKVPLQITIRDIPHSEAIEKVIRDKVTKLESCCDRMMSCHVVVESPQRHRHQGKLYNVRLDIAVPGSVLAVNREPNVDIYVAIRDAFNAARRQLKAYMHRHRGEVKNHAQPHHARITKVFPAQGYGFLETPDRREVYFHRNSVINWDFDRLDPGTEVLYVEELGKEGPQAKQVTVGKHSVIE